MIGAPYEFDRGNKTKDFPLFSRGSQFTDDSAMTIAVAEALMGTQGMADDEVKAALVHSMQKWGKRYPHAGYGGMFRQWLWAKHPKPYGSFGNGSAMRASAAGWLYGTLEESRHAAKLTAEVTHNHPEGIKGAEATAGVIFLARTGNNKEEIREYITAEFGYDLSRSCDEIRPGYRHNETCQKTVPEAITAFLEGTDFEDVIRTAVSLGGDSDTLTCIAGSMAEAFYGIPENLIAECRNRLPKDMLEVLDRFDAMRASSAAERSRDPFLDGNALIETAISNYHTDASKDNLVAVLDIIRQRMHADGHFILPVLEEENGGFTFRAIKTNDDKLWQVAFTSQADYAKGEPSQVLSNFIDSTLKACLDTELEGVILNPWGQSFLLTKELIELIFKADEGIEYSVPDETITAELLEDGSFLKRATQICNRNRTQLNMLKLLRILRDSWVWIPCNAILSDADYKTLERQVKEAESDGGLDSLVGLTIENQDVIRMVPDILQNGEEFFFPVFSGEEEMGEYGTHFSKVAKHFLEAAALARNNEKKVKGIVINAFTDPFVVPVELIDVIAEMPSNLDKEGEADNE